MVIKACQRSIHYGSLCSGFAGCIASYKHRGQLSTLQNNFTLGLIGHSRGPTAQSGRLLQNSFSTVNGNEGTLLLLGILNDLHLNVNQKKVVDMWRVHEILDCIGEIVCKQCVLVGYRILWVEVGNRRSGLRHIQMRHLGDFVRCVIFLPEIVPLIRVATSRGNMIGWQGSRPIFATSWGGKKIPVAVEIADNGYIVSANPSTGKPRSGRKVSSGRSCNQKVEELGDHHVVEMVVMADYGCYPIWITSDDGMDNIDPGDLIEDQDLVDDINRWSDTLTSEYNCKDPSTPLWVMTEDEVCLHELEGIAVTNRVSLYLKEKNPGVNYETNFHSDVLCMRGTMLSQMASAIYDCIHDKTILSRSCSAALYLAKVA